MILNSRRLFPSSQRASIYLTDRAPMRGEFKIGRILLLSDFTIPRLARSLKYVDALAEEGWARHKIKMDPFRNGAAGVARSASPIGRSLNRGSAKLFRPEDLPS